MPPIEWKGLQILETGPEGDVYMIHPMFSTGGIQRIKINRIFKKTKSGSQEIVVADTEEFGRCLVIDGIIQSCESDHEIYDREMLKLLENDRRLLILGGGDGDIATMALKMNPELRIELVEIDQEVVKNCVEYMEQKVFDDPRVSLHIASGLAYLKNIGGSEDVRFDGVVCDFTGIPVKEKERPDFEEFYEGVISLSKRALKKGGWMSLQAGDARTKDPYIDGAGVLEGMMKRYFKKVSRSERLIPSYGEEDAFLFGRG